MYMFIMYALVNKKCHTLFKSTWRAGSPKTNYKMEQIDLLSWVNVTVLWIEGQWYFKDTIAICIHV